MQHLESAGRHTTPVGRPNHWVEHLRVPTMSVGTYSVPAGSADTQKPHTEDEVYVVTSGRAVFEAAGERIPASAGTVLFVPAHEAHRFVEVTEDLTVIVVFGPAEYSLKA